MGEVVQRVGARRSPGRPLGDQPLGGSQEMAGKHDRTVDEAREIARDEHEELSGIAEAVVAQGHPGNDIVRNVIEENHPQPHAAEEIEPEAIRQGVLLKDGQATTKQVLAEESRIIDFAREGKGTMRPLGYTIRIEDSIQNGSVPIPAGHSHLATSTAVGQQKGRPEITVATLFIFLLFVITQAELLRSQFFELR